MKKLTILLALLVALCLPSFAAAQTSITTTTLTNAITNPTPTTFDIVVGSNSTMAVGSILYIDGSVYRVNAINSTTITVNQVAFPATHAASVTIYIVPLGAQVANNAVGSCLRSTAGRYPAYSPYALMFNTTTGDIGACRLDSGSVNKWVWVNPYAVGSQSNNPPQTR